MDLLIDLLKNTNARISLDNKWLVWYSDEWQVLYRPYGARKNRCLYSGQRFDMALVTLRGDD